MRKQKKSILVLAIITAFVATGVFLPKLIGAGELEPSAPPGPTMKTLDEIPPTWSQTLPASERFVLVLNDEAVLDKETGLVWARDANIANGTKHWWHAVAYCRNLVIGNRKGWRLPTVEELSSLVDPTQSGPALPSGHPFENVRSLYYWSSTTSEADTGRAWDVDMFDGGVATYGKSYSDGYVWPVHGGSGPILVPHTPTP